jgi:cytoskeletal protein RodZ
MKEKDKRLLWLMFSVLLIIVFILLWQSCQPEPPIVTPTPTKTATKVPTATPTEKPTVVPPTPTPTEMLTVTPTEKPTVVPTVAPKPTVVPTPVITRSCWLEEMEMWVTYPCMGNGGK